MEGFVSSATNKFPNEIKFQIEKGERKRKAGCGGFLQVKIKRVTFQDFGSLAEVS